MKLTKNTASWAALLSVEASSAYLGRDAELAFDRSITLG